jgi:hypothetical protein
MRYVDKNDDLFKDVMSEYKFLGGRKFLRQAFKEDPKFLVSAINAYLRNGLSATGNSKLSDAIAKTGGHMVINKVYYGK